MNMTIKRMHTLGKAATGAGASDIVIKDVTLEEFCELCLSRRTLYRSDLGGLRGLFEPATRTHFVVRPRLEHRTLATA